MLQTAACKPEVNPKPPAGYNSTFDISVSSETVIPKASANFASVNADGKRFARSISPIVFLLMPLKYS